MNTLTSITVFRQVVESGSFVRAAEQLELSTAMVSKHVMSIEKQVAEFLRKVMKRGALRTADPKTAAIHLLSLLESELLQRVLLGVMDSVKPEAARGVVRRAVEVFLSGYQRR